MRPEAVLLVAGRTGRRRVLVFRRRPRLAAAVRGLARRLLVLLVARRLRCRTTTAEGILAGGFGDGRTSWALAVGAAPRGIDRRAA